MREFRDCKYVNFKYAKGKTDIYGRMFHDYYEIYILLNGNVEFINDHTRQAIKPLQLLIIPPGEYHQFIVNNDIDNYERCVINIYPHFFETDVLNHAFSEKKLISLTETDRITKHFLYLIECLSNVSDSDFSHILSAVATDIVFLIKNSADSQVFLNGSLSDLSLNLMNYINEHFTEPLDLELLSQKFYCSVSSMCHTFKEDFGISIKKYIIQKRINTANISIQNGKKPEKVSAELGFPNYSTFYRNYKKHFKIAPSQTATRK